MWEFSVAGWREIAVAEDSDSTGAERPRFHSLAVLDVDAFFSVVAYFRIACSPGLIALDWLKSNLLQGPANS